MASEHEPTGAVEPSAAAPTGAAERTSAAAPTGAVERVTVLSDDMIKALEDNGREALAAVGQFAVSLEKALPQEVQATSDVAKEITDAALEMAQRLIRTQSEFLRTVVDSAGTSLRRSEHDQ